MVVPLQTIWINNGGITDGHDATRFNTVLERSSHAVSPQAPCLQFNGGHDNDLEGYSGGRESIL